MEQGVTPIGQRLRNARQALGLTQSQAAEGIIASSFLSLIESGQRTPSPKVLAALADRLRLRLDEPMEEPAAATAALEVALRMGDLDTAEREWARLLPGSPDQRFYLGLMDERRGRLEQAAASLEQVALSPAAPAALIQRAGVALCRIARNTGDLRRSIEVGERTLLELRRSGNADPAVEAELRATLAGTYCETGDLLRARELTVIEDDERLDPWSRATSLWSRAMVHQAAGEFADARACAFDALEILRSLDRPLSEARLRNTAAWIAMQSEPVDSATIGTMLREAEDTFRSVGARNDLAMTLSSQAELALRSGDEASARARINDALALIGPEATGQRARLLAIAGQIHASLGDAARARQELLEARTLLEAAGASRSAAGTWRQLAHTFEEIGEMDLAVACLKAAMDLLGLQPTLRTPTRLPLVTPDDAHTLTSPLLEQQRTS